MLGHGVAGVEREVHQDLMHLRRIGHDRQAAVVEIQLHRDVLWDQRPQHRQGLAYERVHQERLAPPGAALGEHQQLLGQVAGPLGGAAGVAQRVEVPGAGRGLRQHQIEVSEDRGEEVVEVVRDPAGQTPDALQVVHLAEALFQALSLGHVARHQLHRRTTAHRQGQGRDLSVDDGPSLSMDEALFDEPDLVPRAEHGLDAIAHHCPIVFVHEIKQRDASDVLLGIDADQSTTGVVEEDQMTVLVERDDVG
jgi:hypothetical protein